MPSVPTKGPSESQHGDISNTCGSMKEEKPKDRTKPCRLEAFHSRNVQKGNSTETDSCCLGLVMGGGTDVMGRKGQRDSLMDGGWWWQVPESNLLDIITCALTMGEFYSM